MPSRPPAHSEAGRCRSLEKSSDLIGTRTRDLLYCSIVAQPTTLPRAPHYVFIILKNLRITFLVFATKVTSVGINSFFEFKVFAAVIVRGSVFCDVTQYSLVKAYQLFGRTHCLQLHGRRENQKCNWVEASAAITLGTRRRRQYVQPKCWQISTRLYSVTQ
jgi:hypothetical protein